MTDPRMERPIEIDQLIERIQTRADSQWNEFKVVSQNSKVQELIMVLYTIMLHLKAHPNDEKFQLQKAMAEDQIELLLSQPQEKTIITG
jgi:hypothetical protein